MKNVLAAAVIAVLAIVVVMFLRDGKESTHGAWVAHSKKQGAAETYSPEMVLKIAPSARPATPRPAPDVSKRSALALEIRDSKNWKPIYDRLRATAETPEGAYYLAMMLSACADVTDRKSKRPPPEEARAKFVASISPKDTNRAARLTAYDATMAGERCAELRQVATTEQEIKDLRARAAAGGDPKARANQIAQEIWATTQPTAPPGSGNPTITDAQLAALREITRSGDPTALQSVGSVLASTLGNLHIRAGPDEQPVDPRAFHDAWLLASCEFGASCGRDNGYVASACAYQGRCGAESVSDYLYFYGHSPAQSQNVGDYTQHLLNAIRSGDWSYFQFVREAPPNASQSTYRFGGPN